MAIQVVPRVVISESTAWGHGGVRANFMVYIDVGGEMLYVLSHAGYSDSSYQSFSEAKKHALKVGRLLQMEVVHKNGHTETVIPFEEV